MIRTVLSRIDILIYLVLFASLTQHFLPISSVEKIPTLKSYIIKKENNISKSREKSHETGMIKTEVIKIPQIPPSINYHKVNFMKRLLDLNASLGQPIFIRIFKEEALLEVWIKSSDEYKLFKYYKICNYSGDLGPKLKEGDKQSPEGYYTISKSQLNPKSKFYLSFNLGYPNAYERSVGRTGSYLMVHGECVSIGCYAMTNERIEEIYTLVEFALNAGQKKIQVHAFPFRLNKENMAKHTKHEWYDFWVNLKEGYDYFESEKRMPIIWFSDEGYEIGS